MSINELYDLKGKVALVTGASSGLGWRFCQTLAKLGASIIAVARREAKLVELASRVEEAGGTCIPLPLDITDRVSVSRQINRILSKERIDILVNSAGIAPPTPLFDGPPEDAFESVLSTNVVGNWGMTREIAKHMRNKQVSGSIINIGSINGAFVPAQGHAAYSASKAAVIHMTRQLVAELSPYNIRVNCIIPGLIHTELTDKQIQEKGTEIRNLIPLGFIAEPQDLDAALMFLASNRASRYVTGACLTVDGGLSWKCP